MDSSRPPNPYSMGPDDFTPFDAYDYYCANQVDGFETSTDLLGNTPDAAVFLNLDEFSQSDSPCMNGYGDPTLSSMPFSYGQPFAHWVRQESSDLEPSIQHQARPERIIESHDNLVPASNDPGPDSAAALAPYVAPSDVLCPSNQSA